jgi:hypothetical protein
MTQFVTYEKCGEAYQNNPQFKALVDMLVNAIEELQYTPGEVKAIAIFAAVLFEQRHPFPRPIPINGDPMIIEKQLRAMLISDLMIPGGR